VITVPFWQCSCTAGTVGVFATDREAARRLGSEQLGVTEDEVLVRYISNKARPIGNERGSGSSARRAPMLTGFLTT
jgi:hypothetical protein